MSHLEFCGKKADLNVKKLDVKQSSFFSIFIISANHGKYGKKRGKNGDYSLKKMK